LKEERRKRKTSWRRISAMTKTMRMAVKKLRKRREVKNFFFIHKVCFYIFHKILLEIIRGIREKRMI
jgi:hypothetical protein